MQKCIYDCCRMRSRACLPFWSIRCYSLLVFGFTLLVF